MTKGKVVIIAGGIATGKSTVMKLLEKIGATTLYADKLNAELLNDKDYISLINDKFPNVVIDGKINKLTLKNIIFNDESARKQLNDIAHPRIFDLIKKRINELNDENIFVEIPLLQNALDYIKYDILCVVNSSYDVRLNRLISRDNISINLAKKILKSQEDEEKLYHLADYTINNDGDLNTLIFEVNNFYNLCLKK